MCCYEVESFDHMLKGCTGEEEEDRNVNDSVRGILDENGQRVGWMKRLEELKENKGWKAS